MKITSFRGEYEFLSNFYPSPFVWHGHGRRGPAEYPTAEHAYQAIKPVLDKDSERIRLAVTPGSAKAIGRRCQIRPDWEQIKLDVMAEILRVKFAVPELRAKLLATGDAELVEVNTWRDRYWGVYAGHGENHLGRLLMAERERIRSEMAT